VMQRHVPRPMETRKLRSNPLVERTGHHQRAVLSVVLARRSPKR
jgi:hypothetical protein